MTRWLVPDEVQRMDQFGPCCQGCEKCGEGEDMLAGALHDFYSPVWPVARPRQLPCRCDWCAALRFLNVIEVVIHREKALSGI